MSTVAHSRALIALIGSLIGAYSTGSLTAKATGADVLLSPGACAVPVVDGALFDDGIVKVEPNPSSSDGKWTVTSSGTQVTVTSLLGGTQANRDADTEFRWSPSIDGLEPTALSTALTGANYSGAFGGLRQMREYDDFGTPEEALAFFRAQTTDYPAAVLGWVGVEPAAGVITTSLGVNSSRAGTGKQLYKTVWSLWICCTRYDGHDERRRERHVLRDNLMSLLIDRIAWRDMTISAPQGIQIHRGAIHHVSPQAYIDRIEFDTTFTLRRCDTRTFNDWLKTRLVMPEKVEGLNPETLDKVDIEVSMT